MNYPWSLLFSVPAISLVLLSTFTLRAQNPTALTPRRIGPDLVAHVDCSKAESPEVVTAGGIVGAFYGALSTPAGGKLDQTPLRSLYVPEGRIAIGIAPGAGRAQTSSLSLRRSTHIVLKETLFSGIFDKNLAARSSGSA